MKRVEKLSDIEVGDVLFSVSRQFNALNIVICIASDFTSLNRNIKYFGFLERMTEIPTAEKFASDMQYNKMTSHTFATWGHSIEGENPTTDLYRMNNMSHIKFCVASSRDRIQRGGLTGLVDETQNFESYIEALKRYNEITELENTYTANISIVMDTTE